MPYRWLRLLLGSNDQPATVADFVKVNSQITDAQAVWLGRHRGLAGFRRLGPLLNYAAQHPRLVSTDGFEVGRDDLPFLQALSYVLGVPRLDRPFRIRLRGDAYEDGKPRPLRIRVEMLVTEKKRWVLSSIQDLETNTVFSH